MTQRSKDAAHDGAARFHRRATRSLWLTAFALCSLAACEKASQDDAHDHAGETAEAPTNRIAAPALVRANLGIQFAPVQRRRVAATLRLPGRFESLPQGRQEYRTPIAGRVMVKVAPMQQVAQGDVLYELDAPEWRAAQRRMQDLVTNQGVTSARLEAMTPLLIAHESHEKSLLEAQTVLRARIEQLEATQREVGGQAEQTTSARLSLAQVNAQLAEAAEKHANLRATLAELRAELDAAQQRMAFELDAATAITGLQRDALIAMDGGEPRWRSMRAIEVRARIAGVADRLPAANGAWVEASGLLAEVVDVSQMRFVAHGLQSDLPRLQDGLVAHIVPVGSAGGAATAGSLRIGITADAHQRSIDLYVELPTPPSWARPEVAAFVEIETKGGAADELAIPSRAVLQDGLQKVIFRRAKDDPDVVIRMEADLGVDDGRWIEVKSGLADGDEIVVDGAYELVLATSGSQQKGGHFHADGTFHAEEDH